MRLESIYNKFNFSTVIKYLVYLFFTIKLVETIYLFNQVDALAYHLVGGRYWIEDGIFQMSKWFIQFFQAGYFDYFYVIPNFIFGSTMLTQISGQSMHFIFSLGLACLVFIKYFKGNYWGFIGSLLILSLSRDGRFWLYAKNDGVLASVTLITSILIFEKHYQNKIKNKKIYFIIVGGLLGLLPGIKMLGLFATIPLSLSFAWINRKNVKMIIPSTLIALIVWAPILIRNYYFLETPFFPGLIKIFPGNLPPGIIKLYSSMMSSPFTVNSLLLQIRDCIFSKLFFFIIPIIWFFNVKFKKEGNEYLYVSVIYLTLYLCTNGSVRYARFFFPCHILLAFYTIKSLSQYKINNLFLWPLTIFILADSKIDLGVKHIVDAIKIYSSKENQKQIINTMIPLTRIWNYVDKNNKDKKIYIISDYSSQVFYSPKNYRLEQSQSHRKADFFYNCTEKQLHKLKRYSYAIITKDIKNPCYNIIRNRGTKLYTLNSYTRFTLYELTYLFKNKN